MGISLVGCDSDPEFNSESEFFVGNTSSLKWFFICIR